MWEIKAYFKGYHYPTKYIVYRRNLIGEIFKKDIKKRAKQLNAKLDSISVVKVQNKN